MHRDAPVRTRQKDLDYGTSSRSPLQSDTHPSADAPSTQSFSNHHTQPFLTRRCRKFASKTHLVRDQASHHASQADAQDVASQKGQAEASTRPRERERSGYGTSQRNDHSMAPRSSCPHRYLLPPLPALVTHFELKRIFATTRCQ